MSCLRHSLSKNVVTLKSGSQVTHGYRKWYRSIDCVWIPISVLYCLEDAPFLRYSTSKMALKSGSEVAQGHRRWYHLIDCFLWVFYSNFVCIMHRFCDIRLVTMQWPWSPGYRSLKVIGTDTDLFATYDFLLRFHSNHGPFSYRFRDIQWFLLQIAKFSHSLLFCIPAEGVTLEIGYRRWGQKTRMMRLPSRQRSLTISSALWIECTNVTDGQTDRRWATTKTVLTHSVAP